MALPESGTITLDQMHVEAGGTTGTTASINDADIRGLIGKTASTTMSFNEWYGAANGPYMKNFAQATLGGGGSSWTATLSGVNIAAGDLLVLIWVAGYGFQSDTDWTFSANSQNNFTSKLTTRTSWVASWGYLKNAIHAVTAPSAATSGNWQFQTSGWSADSVGMKAIIAVIGNAASIQLESLGSGTPGTGYDVRAANCIGISYSTSSADFTPTPVIVTQSPSVQSSSIFLQGVNNTSNYDIRVAYHIATAGDFTNGYFNVYQDYSSGTRPPYPLGAAVSII